MFRKPLVTALLLLLSSGAFAQKAQKIDSLLQSLHASGKFYGNVLVAEKGKIIYRNSFGNANETTVQKLNGNSIFELASVSKPFTAQAVMILKEQGKLRLDDKLVKYIPEISVYQSITIKNLLNHTSGLADYKALLDSSFDKSKIATNSDVVASFAALKPPLLFQPGSKFEYCNTGYLFLATIIEKVSGLTYDEFLRKNIFEPSQMKNTFVYRRRYSPKRISNYALGYVYSDSLKKYILPDDMKETTFVIWMDGIVGSRSLNSTLMDLWRWDRALYTDNVLSRASKNEMFAFTTFQDGTKEGYGYGFELENDPTYGKIVFHSGGWPGYSTFIDRHIDHNITIIVLQNHDNVSMPIRSLRKILYEQP